MSNSLASDPMIRRSPITNNMAAGVLRLQHLVVNSYLVGQPGAGTWAVVDAGLAAMCATKIISAAAQRYGRQSRPEAIILTHGHFDHVGAVRQLAQHWNVPVYAHELELPYLTGRSCYPPPDPTVGGGLMARMAALYPRKPVDLGALVGALPGDGVVPGMPGWRWVPTPGHSPGHVSLFRFTDRTLIVGDAFVTVKQESMLAVLTQRQEVSRPPAYFTTDWQTARRSLEKLLALEPEIAATGHGIPMAGEPLRDQLRTLVREFDYRGVPARGRYVYQPAITNETGVVSVPPPVPDRLPKFVCAGLVTLALLVLATSLRRNRRLRPAQIQEDMSLGRNRRLHSSDNSTI